MKILEKFILLIFLSFKIIAEEPITIQDLLSSPKDYINKEISFGIGRTDIKKSSYKNYSEDRYYIFELYDNSNKNLETKFYFLVKKTGKDLIALKMFLKDFELKSINEDINLDKKLKIICSISKTLEKNVYTITANKCVYYLDYEQFKKKLYKKHKKMDKLLIEILNIMKDSDDIKKYKKIILKEFIKENLAYIDKPDKKTSITPIFSAVAFGNFDAVKLLVENGVDLFRKDKKNKTIFQYTNYIKDIKTKNKIAEYLKNQWKNIFNKEELPSSEFDDLLLGIKKFETLINISKKVNIKEVVNNESGGTYAIIEAAFLNQPREVKDLVKKYAADINVQDKKGYTALMLAAYCECEKMVKLLLKLGADINIQNKKGLSAIFIAGNEKIFYLLLKNKKININLQDNKGNTILHYAAKSNDYKLVKDLLKKKADKTLVNMNKARPIELATDKKVIKILEK